MPTTKIDSYQVMYSANSFSPRIWLKSGNTFIGQLIFEADGTTLPVDSSINGNTNVYYHLQNFAHCIDILRNESPVFLLFSGSGGGFENGLQTGAERVGDGDKI
jgi:hypothetical protein